MIKAILIAMLPTALLFTFCYIYKWRYGKSKPQMVSITTGKPDRE